MIDCTLLARGSLWRLIAQTPPVIAVPSAQPSVEQSDSFLSIIFSGGVLGISIMLALIALSLITVYLIVEQALTLRRKDITPSHFSEEVRQLLTQGRLKEADQLCREKPSPLAFIIASGIAEVEFGWPDPSTG